MTKQLEAVLAYLREHHAKWGVLPSQPEIADHFRVKVSTVKNWYGSLRKAGHLGVFVSRRLGKRPDVVYRLKEVRDGD